MSSSWNSSYGNNEEEEEDEVDLDEKRQASEQQRDCLVYLIDASPPMHNALDSEGSTAFTACVAAAAAQFKSRIINDHRDKVAVVLFGTRVANNSLGFNAVNILQDMDEPSAARIQQLERLSDPSSTIFESDIGPSSEYNLHEALWIVNQLFSKSAKKNDHKRVFIMTNTTNPHPASPDLQRLAITRAKDLRDTDAILYLFGLDTEENGPPFDFDAFYKDNIIVSGDDSLSSSSQSLDDSQAEQEEETRYFNASGGLEALTHRVEQKVFKKRSVFACPFILGDGFEFGIRGYNLISEVKPSSYTYLVAATNEEAAVQTSYFCKTSSQQLALADMDSYYPYGGVKAVFTKEEVAQIKYFGEPGMRLIGFKPRAAVLRKLYYNLKHSVFVVPDDASYVGSSSIFIQFLARVHAKDKAVICSYMPKKNASPRVVALLPQMEEYDEKGNVVKPSGFHMIHIPFSDDLRKPDAPAFSVQEMVPLLAPAVKVFGEIIDKTTIKNFTVYNYPNPTLQKHYANLAAVALKKDAAEDVPDCTLPNFEAISKRLSKSNFIPSLLELLPEVHEDAPAPKTASKRKAADSDGPATPKRAKASASGDVDEDAVKRAFEEGKLQKLTVPILTAFLKKNGVAGIPKKKDGLVLEVENFFKLKQE
ncbi:X-ray repair cross-complementing protein 6 [Rhizoclosmatium sp. JEL0117]|nr:X-ray repair cross-complementing protein 6 [Rhizoclosmatium sp. JEL0117]